MLARNFNTPFMPVASAEAEGARTRTIFNDMYTLPAGNWTLSVEQGDAWVFCTDRDFAVHAGETTRLTKADGPVTIRSLYRYGFARFSVNEGR
jgi:hypothetical protein